MPYFILYFACTKLKLQCVGLAYGSSIELDIYISLPLAHLEYGGKEDAVAAAFTPAIRLCRVHMIHHLLAFLRVGRFAEYLRSKGPVVIKVVQKLLQQKLKYHSNSRKRDAQIISLIKMKYLDQISETYFGEILFFYLPRVCVFLQNKVLMGVALNVENLKQ